MLIEIAAFTKSHFVFTCHNSKAIPKISIAFWYRKGVQVYWMEFITLSGISPKVILKDFVGTHFLVFFILFIRMAYITSFL